ncbi:IS982 family transposase, partial [Muribaculaceae bacterium Isolate-001 (NCI)]
MITENKITEIFCLADDFCKYFSPELKKPQISDGNVQRNKPGKLSDAEDITKLIIFH